MADVDSLKAAIMKYMDSKREAGVSKEVDQVFGDLEHIFQYGEYLLEGRTNSAPE